MSLFTYISFLSIGHLTVEYIFNTLYLYYSCLGNVSPTICSNGTYSGTGEQECTQCPVGHQCSTDGLLAPIPCPLGTYSNDTGRTDCVSCPAGHQCRNTSQTPESCPDGSYSVGERSECLLCPGGYR